MKRKVFTDGNGSKHIFVEGLGEYSPKQDHDSLVEEVERLRGERDELVNALSGIHKEAVDYQSRTGKPVTWCLKIGKLLAKIKGEDSE